VFAVPLLCVHTESKLKEYDVVEKDVLRILTQVNVARRECEIVRTLPPTRCSLASSSSSSCVVWSS